MSKNLLTKSQRDKIKDLTKYHHYALVIELLGEDSVPPAILTEVKARGLYRKPRPDVMKKAYQFGKLGVIDNKILEMNGKEFSKYLKKHARTMDSNDRETLSLLHRSFSNYLGTLSDDLEKSIEQTLLKEDRKLQRVLGTKTRPEMFMELERRKSISSIAKDLSKATEKQVSKAGMVAATETNNAFQDGRSQQILSGSGDPNPLVFKRPRHDACDECKKAYLEGDGLTPKLFRMSELVDNGTNIGKSRGDRLPVIESFHPYCACEISWLPRDFGFGADGGMVYIGSGGSTRAN